MSRPGRADGVVQVVIMVAIGGAAAAASFTHVHDLTVAHGQPSWLGWCNAVVLELMSLASGLEIRRRHRTRQPAGFVVAVLVGAVGLSLAAQVAEAERSPWGWIVAALPAAGFLCLVKLVLSRPVAVDESGRPSGTADEGTHAASTPADEPDEGVGNGDTLADGPARDTVAQPDEPDPLVPVAAEVVGILVGADKNPTRDALAAGLRDRGHRVGTARAGELLKAVRAG